MIPIDKKINILSEARKLLAQPYGWTKGRYTSQKRTRKGEYVPCYCALGALMAIDQPKTFDLELELERTLRDRGYFDSVAKFNDLVCKKKADILGLFDETIARLEAQAA